MFPVSQYVGAAVTTLLLPIIVAVVATVRSHRATRRGGDGWETFTRTWLIGGVALGATIIALTFLIIPNGMADSMGYAHSPFQFEVLGTNLAFAVMAVLAARQRTYRSVVAIGFAIFMGWALIGHAYQAIAHGNLTPGNLPGILIYDLGVPLVLLILVFRRRTDR